MKEVKPSKLKVSKQTVATLNANQLYAVRAGYVQPESYPPSSTWAATLILSLFSTC
jgi:hypothetical protein